MFLMEYPVSFKASNVASNTLIAYDPFTGFPVRMGQESTLKLSVPETGI